MLYIYINIQNLSYLECIYYSIYVADLTFYMLMLYFLSKEKKNIWFLNYFREK